MADDLVDHHVYMCMKFKQEMEAVMAPYKFTGTYRRRQSN